MNNVINDAFLGTLRHEQSHQVNPVALAIGCNGRHGFVALEHGTHIDAQCHVIILDALVQQRSLDDVLVIVIGAHLVATGGAQVLQNLLASQHLADGERA